MFLNDVSNCIVFLIGRKEGKRKEWKEGKKQGGREEEGRKDKEGREGGRKKLSRKRRGKAIKPREDQNPIAVSLARGTNTLS